MDQMLCKEFYFSSGENDVQKSRTGWVALVEGLTRSYKECHCKFYEMISNLGQYNVVHLLFKIFLIYSSGGHLGWQSGIIWASFRSLRITAAEVVVILWVHRYKIFIFFSFLIFFLLVMVILQFKYLQ